MDNLKVTSYKVLDCWRMKKKITNLVESSTTITFNSVNILITEMKQYIKDFANEVESAE